METAARTSNPWISIWTRPRATVREVIHTSPFYVVLILAGLAGIGSILDNASLRNMGDAFPVPTIVLVAVLLGPAFGILGLYVGAAVIGWTGRWLGGGGRPRELRTAMAWAGMPMVVGLLVWLFDLSIFGSEMFTTYTPRLMGSPFLALLMIVSGLVSMALGIWTLVLQTKAIGEVHGFSAWKGLGSMALGLLLIMVPFIALGIVAAMLAA